MPTTQATLDREYLQPGVPNIAETQRQIKRLKRLELALEEAASFYQFRGLDDEALVLDQANDRVAGLKHRLERLLGVQASMFGEDR